jgi:hypothetical protein
MSPQAAMSERAPIACRHAGTGLIDEWPRGHPQCPNPWEREAGAEKAACGLNQQRSLPWTYEVRKSMNPS